jgi:hypothetical protein
VTRDPLARERSSRGVKGDGFRPIESDELLLRVALSPPSEAAPMWSRVGPAVELRALESSSHDLLPLLYRTLVAAGVEDRRLALLKGVYRRTWYSNQLLLRRAGEALGELGRKGIAASVFGGAALGLLHYRELGARAMWDTRIAVRPASVERARTVLSAVGWDLRCLSSEDGERWAASVPLEIGDVKTCAPGPSDQLLRACAHGARSSGIGSWRWVADAFTILESSPGAIDWQRLLAHAVDRRVAPHLHMALSYLRDTFAAAVPSRVIESLGPATTPLGVGRPQRARGRGVVTPTRSL